MEVDCVPWASRSGAGAADALPAARAAWCRAIGAGTLLLEGLQHLNQAQQLALYDWMTTGRHRCRSSRSPLATSIRWWRKGEFLEGLFSRLNVVRLDIRAPDEA